MLTRINGFKEWPIRRIFIICTLFLVLGICFSSYAFAAADEQGLQQVAKDFAETIIKLIKDHVIILVAIGVGFYTIARLVAGAYLAAAISALAFILLLFLPKMISVLGG